MGMWLMCFPWRFGPIATVTGTVVDAEARYPLLGATVHVDFAEHVTTADLDGRFELVEVPLGRHALKVSFIGYEPRVLDGIVDKRPSCGVERGVARKRGGHGSGGGDGHAGGRGDE